MDKLQRAIDKAVPQEVRTISRVLHQAGHASWLVGGSVRDIYLAVEAGRAPEARGDWDFATEARPEQVMKLFQRVIPTGIQHGTVTIVLSKKHFEVTTLRGEKGHTDGRRPDEVYFVDDLKEDLARRDFTINAMAFNLEDSSFHDPFCGAKDLKAKQLVAVGEPLERFSEDGLRVLRGARFCATLNMNLEANTEAGIEPSLESFKKVAQERVRDEWFKALSSAHPSRFFQVIRKCGLLEITAPALSQHIAPHLPTFDRICSQIDTAPRKPITRLALFVALVCSLETTPQIDAKLTARALGSRLKLSRVELSELVLLAEHTSMNDDFLGAPSDEKGRRWIRSVGKKHAEAIMCLQKIAELSSPAPLAICHSIVQEQLKADAAVSIGELQIKGGDLIAEASVPKGPQLGETLALLLEAVIQDPSLNSREKLLALARERASL